MMGKAVRWIGVVGLVSTCVLGSAQKDLSSEGKVEARLVADVSAVEDGTSFTVGVLFKISPGWHIYWKNPGESGYATTVQWESTGAQVGEAQYPAPIRFISPGPQISYGYEDEVLLLAPVQPPAGLGGAAEVHLKAKLRWLQCSDRCLPGRTDVELKLRVGKAVPANAELFRKYRELLPKEQVPSNVSWQVSGGADARQVELQVKPAGKGLVAEGAGATEKQEPGVRPPFFFPEKLKGAEISVPEVSGTTQTVKAAGARGLSVYTGPVKIALKVRGAGAEQLTGVLVQQAVDARGQAGKPEVARFRVPLSAGK